MWYSYGICYKTNYGEYFWRLFLEYDVLFQYDEYVAFQSLRKFHRSFSLFTEKPVL